MKIIIVLVLLISSTFLFMEAFAQGVDLPNDFGTIVYQFDGQYYVKDSQNIIISDHTPDIVIKTALARGGDIYIAGGTYYLSNDFSGFDLKSDTHLKLAENANIIIPSGYSGHVFRFNSDTFGCIMDGGNIYEEKPVKRNWTGIMMQGGTSGVFFNYVENMVVTNPYIVIDFNATTGQWINANTFVNIQADNFVRGIEFDFNGKHTDSADGFDGNTFRDSQFQSGPMTTYGVKDIKHQYNAFYNVQFWDLPLAAISATIDPSAKNTIIVGGIMTIQNFVDDGKNTIILDAWHTKNLSNSTIISAIIQDTYQPKVNMPASSLHQVLNMSIIQQPTNGFVSGNQGLLTIFLGQSTVVNIFGTVTNPTGGSVLLNIIRPDGVIEQNQADVTTSGAFYDPIIFDKNSLTGQYKIDGSYRNSNLGSLFLNVTTNKILPNESSVQPNINTIPSFQSNTTLSTQLKNDAKLWSHGEISDNSFWSDIKYLVKIGIIKNPDGNQTHLHQSINIPTWFKNNAGWWVDGQISDDDFISGMQYLLDNRIMQIPSVK